MIPNLSYGLLDYEADFCIISKSGYLTEVEIKRSWADFIADFKKAHTHNDQRVYNFYWCLPISLMDKAKAFLIEKYGNAVPATLFYDESGNIKGGGGWASKGGRKLFIEEQLKVAKLCALRMWNLKEKYENS